MAGRKPGAPKTGGRKRGVPNKTTALLKDAILLAAERAGGDSGLVGYLTLQAMENPGPFMSLLGKVLPTQVDGPGPDGAHLHRLDMSPVERVRARLDAIASRATGKTAEECQGQDNCGPDASRG